MARNSVRPDAITELPSSLTDERRITTSALEIKLVDVVFGDEQRRAEDDLTPLNLDSSERACLHRCGARLQLVPRNLRRCVHGEISEVMGIPENHGLHHAVLDIA